MEKEVKIRTYN